MSILDNDLRRYDEPKYYNHLRNLSYNIIDNKITAIDNKITTLYGFDSYGYSYIYIINKIINSTNTFLKNNSSYINNQKNIIYYLNLFLNSLKINKSLKYLYTSTHELIDDNYLILNKNFYKNIEYITVYHSMFKVFDSDHILPIHHIEFLAKNILNYPCLKKLKFKTRYYKSFTDHTEYVQTNLFDVKLLRNSLETNKTLQILKFNNIPYKHNIIYPHVDYILKGLIKNTSLKKLDLYYFNIEDITLLIQLLNMNNYIEKIKLWKCNLKLDENLYCKTNKIIIYKSLINLKSKNISTKDFIILLQDILKNKRLNNVSKKYFKNIFKIDDKKIETKTIKGCVINCYKNYN